MVCPGIEEYKYYKYNQHLERYTSHSTLKNKLHSLSSPLKYISQITKQHSSSTFHSSNAQTHTENNATSPLSRLQTRLLPLRSYALHNPCRGATSLRTLPGTWLDSEARLGETGTACRGNCSFVSFVGRNGNTERHSVC